jgi:eukaryotic-like serine/threonine-protein kinase
MKEERWRHIKAIFQSAIEVPPAGRDAFIAEACAGDAVLHQEIRSLIFHHEDAGGTIEDLVADAAGRILQRPDARLLVGRKLGVYEIISHIGQGGMAEVYLASDTRLKRRVALKLLLPELTADPQRLSRFRREAQVVSALNHPNIVTIHEVRHFGSLHFMVTELVEGQSLRRLISDGQLAIGRILDIAAQIVAALEAAHQAGIVHRDIKPENIMLRSDGYVKVLDFGIAKFMAGAFLAPGAGSGTVPGILIGTVSYMSPEQVRGLNLDHRTDIFSLGVVLYEMISGRRPFDGTAPGDTIAHILTREPELLSVRNPAVPADLEQLVGRCLAKEREGRWQSAHEVADKLAGLRRAWESGRAVAKLPAGRRGQTMLSGLPRPAALVLTMTVLVVVFGLSLWRPSGEASPEIRSLAVLPLVDTSGIAENSRFADGMTRMLIDNLSRVSQLRVIAPTSVMRYKSAEKSLSEIAGELQVDSLVQGRVLRSENRVRIAVKFIHARTGRQLWADSYEQDLGEITAMQQRVARDIASQIRIELTPREREQWSNARPVKAAAFDAYLNGHSYLSQRNETSLKRAIEYFRKAIAEDPGYALPHVGIAESYFALGTVLVGAMRPVQALAEVEAASAQALKLDGTLPEALTIRAVERMYSLKWEEAEQGLRRVIDLYPNYAPGHTWYAVYQAARGRLGEAIARSYRAAELDPLSPHISQNVGWQLQFAGRFEEAIEQYHRTFELAPEFKFAQARLAQTYLQKGLVDEAVAAYESMIARWGRDPVIISGLGHVYGKAGRRAEAEQILEELAAMTEERYVNPQAFFSVHLGLDEKDMAFEWLEQCYRDRSYMMVFIKVDNSLEPLRSDSRFEDLLRRTGNQ